VLLRNLSRMFDIDLLPELYDLRTQHNLDLYVSGINK